MKPFGVDIDIGVGLILVFYFNFGVDAVFYACSMLIEFKHPITGLVYYFVHNVKNTHLVVFVHHVSKSPM